MPIDIQQVRQSKALAFAKQPIESITPIWDVDGAIVGLKVQAQILDSNDEMAQVAVNIWPKLIATKQAAYTKAFLEIAQTLQHEVE